MTDPRKILAKRKIHKEVLYLMQAKEEWSNSRHAQMSYFPDVYKSGNAENRKFSDFPEIYDKKED